MTCYCANFILLVTHLQYVSAKLLNIIVQYLILLHGSGSVKMLSGTDAACVATDLAKCLKKFPLNQKMIPMNTTTQLSQFHDRLMVEWAKQIQHIVWGRTIKHFMIYSRLLPPTITNLREAIAPITLSLQTPLKTQSSVTNNLSSFFADCTFLFVHVYCLAYRLYMQEYYAMLSAQ